MSTEKREGGGVTQLKVGENRAQRRKEKGQRLKVKGERSKQEKLKGERWKVKALEAQSWKLKAQGWKENISHPRGIGFAFHRAGRRTRTHTDNRAQSWKVKGKKTLRLGELCERQKDIP